ncbi:MAG: hypothetical protein ACOCXC_01695 [Fibrobacterota bacterium]
MNRIHDHTRAIPSTEADRIEEEIEQIQDSLGELIPALFSALRTRVLPILRNRRVITAVGLLYAYCFLRSLFCSKNSGK